MADERIVSPELPEDVILSVRNVSKRFTSKGVCVRAVSDVSFDVHKGETIGIVGESGCGKTTLGRCIVRAIEASDGEVIYKTLSGEDVNFLTLGKLPEKAEGETRTKKQLRASYRAGKRQMKAIRREIQMIFQDPYSSLDPRMTVLDIIGEPLRANYSSMHPALSKFLYGVRNAVCGVFGREAAQPKPYMPKEMREALVKDIAAKVGLDTSYLMRYPHAFSGGQRQRIGIARALVLNPQLIVCDEAVSALDVSIQAQIINLLRDLQREMNLTYIFISHDLSVVEHISSKVGVMYLGRMVEFGETEKLFANPKHPYTEALLSAVPVADPDVKMERIPLAGEIPNPANPPSGCYFHTRCRYCTKRCEEEAPELRMVDGRMVACHLADELNLRGFDYSCDQ